VPWQSTILGLDVKAEYRLYPHGYRVLALGLILFAVFLVAWLLINEETWRRLTSKQARLYLRSTLLQWVFSDLRSVIRRTLRRRRRTHTVVPRTAKTAESDNSGFAATPGTP
ncbi:MAG: hypothetical protein KDA89_17390, partial [Planctomycetaceae bacterium]|nr:hypothetical protein [Planctomycetaceae bacterium]